MDKLQGAINDAFENVKKAEGEERGAAVEEIKTLYELQLAEKKLDFEAAKEECRLEEQAKQRRVDTIKEVVIEGAKLALVGFGTLWVLAFEKNDSINDLGARDFLKNIPKIRL